MPITKEDVIKGIQKYCHRYATKDKKQYVGCNLSGLKENLRELGWRNISSLDMYDIRKLGIQTVEAEYINGARPTGKFCEIAVLKEVPLEEYFEHRKA